MEPKKTLLQSAVITGLYLALAGIILFVLEYVADIRPVGIIMPFVIMLVNFAVIITVLVIFMKKYRTSLGGYISFGNAFLYGLLAFVTSTIISTIFTYIFVNYFDPHYMQNILQAQKDYMENYLSGKVSEEKLAQTLDQIDAQAANANSLMSTIKNMSFGLIFGAIVSLIVGAILQKKESVFENTGTGGVI